MTDTTITINSTDAKLGRSISIGYRSVDKSTSLVLQGDSTFNYGQSLLTNLVWLTENFCNTTAPSNPVSGQKFYNSDEKQLYVYHETLNEDNVTYSGDWSAIAITDNTNSLDIVYETELTSSHSNRLLTDYTKHLVPLTGNTTPVELTLIDVEPTLDNQAVTKKYADSILTKPVPYVPKSGEATMTGPLILSDIPRANSGDTLVNIKYVKELGTVTVNDDIRNPFNVITFQDVGRKNDDGTDDLSPWFTQIWFNETIPDGSNSKQLDLPVEFLAATSPESTYNYSMAVTCNSVDSFENLHVTINTGSSITVLRTSTTDDLKFTGCVYGFRDR